MENISLQETIIINNGTGAGGCNTTIYGKQFEENTNNEKILFEKGFIKQSLKNTKSKCGYYLSNEYPDKKVFFVSQGGLKLFVKQKYDINLFRCPDEAYIIEYNDGRRAVKIIEKKEQNREGFEQLPSFL